MLLHQETFAVLNVGNRICGNLLADVTGIGSFEILLGIEPEFRNVIEGSTGLGIDQMPGQLSRQRGVTFQPPLPELGRGHFGPGGPAVLRFSVGAKS